MANHVIPMICEAIRAGLTQYCITDIPFKDPTRLSDIKVGRYQTDPNVLSLRASIQGGDLEDTKLMDGIVTDQTNADTRLGFRIAPRELGGSQAWYRWGTVRIELFFIIDNLEEDIARERAYTILGRIQGNIEKIRVSHIVDDFDEHAIKLFSTQSSMLQSGGPPSSYLWRGKVVWCCLTERDWSE